MDPITARVFDLMPLYIGSTDAGMRCRYANKAYAELLNRSPETMLGVPVEELWGEAIFEEVRPFLERALAGERVSFSKRIRHFNGESRFGKVDLVPEPDGGYMVVMRDLDAIERQNKDRLGLIHELDHKVNNILQILQSVLALEAQSASGTASILLGSIKARVDALALSYELLSGVEPPGGWPLEAVLERVAYSVGPGVSATCAAEANLLVPSESIETFVFIATELARWAASDGKHARIEARRIPEGLELSVEGESGMDLTASAGAAGIALVESFAGRCGAGPLRGGSRLTIIFPPELAYGRPEAQAEPAG